MDGNVNVIVKQTDTYQFENKVVRRAGMSNPRPAYECIAVIMQTEPFACFLLHIERKLKFIMKEEKDNKILVDTGI